MANRRLNSWIGGFLDYTKSMGVGSLFRRWSAIAAISGALERRCPLVTSKGELYPNMFVLLVSPPGVGKTIIVNVVRDFWARTPGLNIAPASTTRSGLINFMIAHKRIDMSRPLPAMIHSLLFAAEEFIDLVPEYDNAWMSMLHGLYDCKKTIDDVTIAHGERIIENAHMVLLAGTQPKYLDALLPEAAFGMGFFSRLLLVYAGERHRVDIFSGVKKSSQLEDFLSEDLLAISKLNKEFYFSPEAQDLWRKLYEKDFAPIPEHSKLQHYCTRREAHLLKLTMCMTAAETDDLKVTPDRIEKALALLHETETLMPQIFQEMASKGYADANEEVWAYAMQTWLSNGRKPIHESSLIKFMVGKFPNNQIKPTLDLLVQSGQLKLSIGLAAGASYRAYIPQKK